MPPTFVSLWDISDCQNCGEARERIGVRGAMLYAPRMVVIEDGICFVYEGDVAYEESDLEIEGVRHRLYMVNDQLDYIRQF